MSAVRTLAMRREDIWSDIPFNLVDHELLRQPNADSTGITSMCGDDVHPFDDLALWLPDASSELVREQLQTFHFEAPPHDAAPTLPSPDQGVPVLPTPSPTSSTTPAFTPSTSPSHSHPNSPRGGIVINREGSNKVKVPRHKRPSHINAELKRRGKIKDAFDELKSSVPSLAETLQSGGKESKSGILNKTVDYCRQLRMENKELQRETENIRVEIRALTADINTYQTRLPAAGLTHTRPSNPAQVEAMFEQYSRERSKKCWKFWIFGLLIRPLFESYNQTVVTSNMENFGKSVMTWVQEHCSLTTLRPTAFNLLRHLSTSTSVMTTPDRLEAEIREASLGLTVQEGARGALLDLSPGAAALPPVNTSVDDLHSLLES